MRRRRAVPCARRAARGFTLLEVLLAFVIFALSFATVMEIMAGSMRSTTRARADSEVALLAQSLMDMAGTEAPLQEGSLAGEAPGGYQWQMAITAYQTEAGDERILELAERSGIQLYWVDLDINWDDGRRERSARFSTVRGAELEQR